MRPYIICFVVYWVSLSLPSFLSVAHHRTVMTLIPALTWHHSLSVADSRRYCTMLIGIFTVLHHESSMSINYSNPGYSLSLLAAMFLLSAFWDSTRLLYYCLNCIHQMQSIWPVKHVMHCCYLESQSITIFYAPHIISLYSRKVMCKIARQLCEKSIASAKSVAGLKYFKNELAKLSKISQGMRLCHSRCIILHY